MAAREPVFMSDGEVDPISENRIRLPQNRIRSQEPPRIPRDRVLTFGQMLAMVVTVGVFLYGAGFLVWEWARS